ncbi:MAG: dienelactone hydrolase family protein [Acidimicrobiales bacterium]
MSARRPSLVLAPLLVAALLGACSDDGDSAPTTAAPPSTAAPTTEAEPTTTEDATTTEAPSTTLSLEQIAATYAEPGPYPVGVTTYQLAKGPSVEVWYPAVEGTTGEVTYDVRDFTPPAIKDILTGDVPATFTFEGARDAAAADGQFPVVLFSHGFTGIRLQSSFLTSHLASWGFVVAAPDHPSRDLTNVLAATATGDRADSVDDLLQTLDLVVAQGADASSLLSGHVDGSKVVAVGHSAGGGTVVDAAKDDRIAGYVSLASGVLIGGQAPATEGALPDKPSFFMAGSVDAVVPAADLTIPSFEAVPAPSLLWVIDGVGHNGFDDFCTFGGGTGIIGVAEASGLGEFLNAQPQLRALGEDGCIPPAVPVDETFPIIRHGVTAWIRALFGIDPSPVGIGPDYADAFVQPVDIRERD